MDCIHGLYTWIVYMDCIHCLYTWIEYMDCIHGLYTWIIRNYIHRVYTSFVYMLFLQIMLILHFYMSLCFESFRCGDSPSTDISSTNNLLTLTTGRQGQKLTTGRRQLVDSKTCRLNLSTTKTHRLKLAQLVRGHLWWPLTSYASSWWIKAFHHSPS